MQNIMRNYNRAGCWGRKGISQSALRRWQGDAPSRALEYLHGVPALPRAQKGPRVRTVPLIVLLPVLGKALTGW